MHHRHTLALKMSGLAVVLSVLALAVVPPSMAASPPEPTYGTANVDGLTNEWVLVSDFFANMHRAGKEDKPIESKLYLRYDCVTGTMYVLVLTEPGIPAIVNNNTAWVAIDNQNNKVVLGISGDDGFPPDFAWVAIAYDGDATHARGYEASFNILPGTYEIITHVNVFDAANQQTSATIGFPGNGPDLRIVCGVVPVKQTTWSQIKGVMPR